MGVFYVCIKPLPFYFVIVILCLGFVLMIPPGGASIRPDVTLTVLWWFRSPFLSPSLFLLCLLLLDLNTFQMGSLSTRSGLR